MMNNIGEIFKKLRTDKKYSLKKVSEGILSISLLSKFERGDSEITISKFFLLLKRLNISLEEFGFILNGYKEADIHINMKEINQAYLNNNISFLIHLENQALENWEKTNNIAYKLSSIMIKSIAYDLDKNILLTQKDIDFFVDYLFKIDNWNLFEIILFGNSMHILKKETAIILSKEMLKKTFLYLDNKKVKEELLRVIINTIIFCLEKKELDSVPLFIMSVEKILEDNTTYYFEKTKLHYLKGIYNLLTNNTENGKKMCEEALSVMKLLDKKSLSYNHEHYMNEIIEFSNMINK